MSKAPVCPPPGRCRSWVVRELAGGASATPCPLQGEARKVVLMMTIMRTIIPVFTSLKFYGQSYRETWIEVSTRGPTVLYSW